MTTAAVAVAAEVEASVEPLAASAATEVETIAAADSTQADGPSSSLSSSSSSSAAPVPTSASAEIVAISQQIRRALECPICLVLASAMSCFCPNGHAVCQSCMLTLLNNTDHDTRCPLCRTSMIPSVGMSATVVKLAEAATMVKVACSNWQYGCTDRVSVRHVNEHESGCRYVPDVPCQVAVCQWVGMYEQLYEHVCNVHPGVAVHTMVNRLNVTDVNEITSNRRRTYLVRSPHGMMWVLLSRGARSRIRTGLFLVKNKFGGRPPMASNNNNNNSRVNPLPDLVYRITWFDTHNRSRTRSRTKWVHWSTSLKEDYHMLLSSAYTMFRFRAGRMEINWYRCPYNE